MKHGKFLLDIRNLFIYSLILCEGGQTQDRLHREAVDHPSILGGVQGSTEPVPEPDDLTSPALSRGVGPADHQRSLLTQIILIP